MPSFHHIFVEYTSTPERCVRVKNIEVDDIRRIRGSIPSFNPQYTYNIEAETVIFELGKIGFKVVASHSTRAASNDYNYDMTWTLVRKTGILSKGTMPSYHHIFIEKYGPCAGVSVKNITDDDVHRIRGSIPSFQPLGTRDIAAETVIFELGKIGFKVVASHSTRASCNDYSNDMIWTLIKKTD